MHSHWIGSAKRPDTRHRGVEKSLESLSDNKKLNDMLGIQKKQGV
jgi:uncharacterized protein YdeI (YjbR/CyaY-like superfamily)